MTTRSEKTNLSEYSLVPDPRWDKAKGFTLIEVVMALIIIMIALLGVFSVFTYAITYNAGNKARAQALAILQQEVERYRAAKFNGVPETDNFTPGDPDDGRRDITGGRKADRLVTATNGMTFTVRVSVDNAPFVANTPDPPNLDIPQNESYTCLSPQGDAVPCTLKEITIEVKLAAPNPGWQTAIPVRTVLRRVRGN
ncbi:MAG TPA: type II secretion system protein [Pyrinomonadaceae bacterium]|nr:type II secretion system protein [Pyrinomonadaceae bacterium]